MPHPLYVCTARGALAPMWRPEEIKCAPSPALDCSRDRRLAHAAAPLLLARNVYSAIATCPLGARNVYMYSEASNPNHMSTAPRTPHATGVVRLL